MCPRGVHLIQFPEGLVPGMAGIGYCFTMFSTSFWAATLWRPSVMVLPWPRILHCARSTLLNISLHHGHQ